MAKPSLNHNPGNFLEELRSRTAGVHKSLEDLPVSRAITAPPVSKTAYVRYLRIMARIVADIEQTLFPMLQDVIKDIDARRKLHLIDSDLSSLGSSKPAFASPFAGETPPSLSFALGIMYVVEGSSLGGRVLLKNIEASPELNRDDITSYFRGYGPETSAQWKQFIAQMTEYESSSRTGPDIIDGAVFGFQIIFDFMQANATI